MDLSLPEERLALGAKIKADIDAFYETNRKNYLSSRLPVSMIGGECAAELWFKFRWVSHPETVDGRMARYNDRGNENEARMVRDLRETGWEVVDVDPVTGKQISATDFNGHLVLKCDGVARHPVHTQNQWILLEFKFVNYKRFSALTTKPLATADEKYYGQVILSLHYLNLPYCLWIPGNRNDDDIKPIIIPADAGYARELIAKSEAIINARQRPARVAENPAFFKCKFCDVKDVCHEGKPVMVNCRSCQHAVPAPDGKWFCTHWNATIPNKEAIMAACGEHRPIA